MRAPEFTVVHLVAGDLAPEPAARLELLRHHAAPSAVTVHVGPGQLPTCLPAATARLHTPVSAALFRKLILRRFLGRHLAPHATAILHAWTPTAAAWAIDLAAGNRPVLCETESDAPAALWGRWSARPSVGFVCGSAARRRALLRAGVTAARCVLIRPPVTVDSPDAGRPAATIRARLGLTTDAALVALAPPLLRDAGGFIAAWATLLVEKVERATRLVVAGAGAEAERVRALVRGCRHDWVLHSAAPHLAWRDIARAADVVAWLPLRAAPTIGLATALCVGARVVASTAPVCVELLGADHPWLCRPNDPEDAARALHRALAAPHVAPGAPPAICAAFEPAAVLAAYRHVYARLASRRPATTP
jgi:hypothetical protein